MPGTGTPANGLAPSLRRELRQWAVAIVVLAPVLALAWLFLRDLPEPWNIVLPTVALLATPIPLIVFGVWSKSNIWQLVVWLGPMVILQLVWLAGWRDWYFSVAVMLAWVWAGGIMLYDRFGKVAFRLVGGAHLWLTALGLPAAKRAAYLEFERAMQATPEERRGQLQLDDLLRRARAHREIARRLAEVVPPDERWASAFDTIHSAFATYADMLEGKLALDFDEMNALLDRGRRLLQEVLRDESPTYRFLTYVPFG